MLRADFIPPDDPGFDVFDASGVAAGFSIVFTIVVLAVVAGIAFSIFVAVRKYRVIKESGHDPLTVDAAKVLNSDLLRPGTAVDDAAPATSLEQRLAEVDGLHARGVISDDERAAARAAILAG